MAYTWVQSRVHSYVHDTIEHLRYT